VSPRADVRHSGYLCVWRNFFWNLFFSIQTNKTRTHKKNPDTHKNSGCKKDTWIYGTLLVQTLLATVLLTVVLTFLPTVLQCSHCEHLSRI